MNIAFCLYWDKYDSFNADYCSSDVFERDSFASEVFNCSDKSFNEICYVFGREDSRSFNRYHSKQFNED